MEEFLKSTDMEVKAKIPNDLTRNHQKGSCYNKFLIENLWSGWK
jgi:hypothetical protein